MGAIEDYWSGVTAQLQVEADTFNRLVHHNGEMGRANELSLAEVLSKLLPPNLGIGTGMLFDSAGNESRQTDLIIFDRHRTPQFLAQSTTLLYPIDSVELTIEVKTTLNAEACVDVGTKVEAQEALLVSSGSPRPSMSLFAFDSSLSANKMASHLTDMDVALQPKNVCILRPGVFGSRASGAPLTIAAVPLHERDASSNDRISNSWVLPKGAGQFERLGSSIYPIESLGTNYRKDLVVFEPGRALLLFCLSILDELAARGAVVGNWWTSYLDAPTVELEPFKYP